MKLILLTSLEYTLRLDSVPIREMYNKARVGQVRFTFYYGNGRQQTRGGSDEEEKFTFTSRHSYNVELDDMTIDSITGVGVQWLPATQSETDKLFPRNFKLVAGDGERVQFCRRQPSLGIEPNKEVRYGRSPACTK